MPEKKPNKAGKNAQGRPRTIITDQEWEQIERLCHIQCTAQEIASIFKISLDILKRNIVETHGITCEEYLHKHAAGGKASLRRYQWDLAKKGNPAMLIWLGKQWLNQSDKQDIGNNANNPLTIQIVKFSDKTKKQT